MASAVSLTEEEAFLYLFWWFERKVWLRHLNPHVAAAFLHATRRELVGPTIEPLDLVNPDDIWQGDLSLLRQFALHAMEVCLLAGQPFHLDYVDQVSINRINSWVFCFFTLNTSVHKVRLRFLIWGLKDWETPTCILEGSDGALESVGSCLVTTWCNPLWKVRHPIPSIFQTGNIIQQLTVHNFCFVKLSAHAWFHDRAARHLLEIIEIFRL